MFPRPEFLQKLRAFKDKQVIKIVSGIRRCGKSTLFILFQEYLRQRGVGKSQIISLNFEDADYRELLNHKKLYDYIKSKLVAGKMNYVFLDEIQNVPAFEKAVDSLFIKKNVDLYLTGSNAYMLSGELATLLSGRYIEIKMLPLSFKEFVTARNDHAEIARQYSDYLLNSSFPQALDFAGNQANIHAYLDGVYNSVILKDVIGRKQINQPRLLDGMVKFLFDNIGNYFSIANIANAIKAEQRVASPHTIENYLAALIDSFILYPARRYDIKGKQHLKSGEKYYAVDMGLRFYLLGRKSPDFGRMLENVIYLELLRRDYRVYVGKIDAQEVDFVAEKPDGTTEYYQVAYTMRDAKTLKRELAALQKIKDHYPKFLLTLDNEPRVTHNGIQQINALDWLLAK